MAKFDVIIIGAGIAGLSAALTAVKNGMRTALVEKENRIGGIAEDCFHTYICGMFKNDINTPFQIANPGICSEIAGFLYNCYGEKCFVKTGRVELLAFAYDDLRGYFLKHLYDGNFRFFKPAVCTEIISKGGRIRKIKIKEDAGTKHHPDIKDIYLEGGIFIDASGGCLSSGVLFRSCDTEGNCSKKYRVMPCTDFSETGEKNGLGGYCAMLKGRLNKDLSLLVPYTAGKIVEKYKLARYLRFVNITHNFLTGKYILKFAVRSSDDVEKCRFIYHKLNENIEELARLTLVKFSGKIHLRTCDVFGMFDNECDAGGNGNPDIGSPDIDNPDIDGKCVVKSYWPAEIWDIERGPVYRYCKNNTPFCVPLSAIRDTNFRNLFLAGKSIRLSGDIHSSARVMGVCMATGEQAFIAAHKYLKQGRTGKNIK